MPKTTKQGSHKRYGPKMANPRFTKSKEDRSCGPLGRKNRHDNDEFTSKKPWTPGTSKVKQSMVIREQKRFQRTKKEVYEYFGLKELE